jgi:hypothetical protein
MSNQIAAIETRYKGYRFRSRLEARWAVFFDAIGLRWEYEPQGFELPGGGRYLPDFFIRHLGLWLEIKPSWDAVADGELARMTAFANGLYPMVPVVSFAVLCGRPWHSLEIDRDRIGGQDYEVMTFGADGFRNRDDQWAACPLCGRFNLYRVHSPAYYQWAIYCRPCDGGGERRDDDKVAWFHKGDSETTDKWLIFPDKLLDDYAAAASARFEHGETPRI